jgi:hypothetical protein
MAVTESKQKRSMMYANTKWTEKLKSASSVKFKHADKLIQ